MMRIVDQDFDEIYSFIIFEWKLNMKIEAIE